MRITIICVGRLKETYWVEAVKEYARRLSRYLRLAIEEVPDEPTPDRASPAEQQQILDREGERILKVIQKTASGPNSRVIALAIDGKRYSSRSFSDHLEQLRVSGTSHIVFVIGGSLGLSDQVLKAAKEHISFSDMTFPHQLMRVILLEQIYRAERIARNEPYDK